MTPQGKIYLTNAFSLSMVELELEKEQTIRLKKTRNIEEIKALLASGFESAIGHASTAIFLTKLLGLNVAMNRTAIRIEKGIIVVFQIDIGRLQPGKELNENDIEKAWEENRAYFVIVFVE
jgi:hypothetical protein